MSLHTRSAMMALALMSALLPAERTRDIPGPISSRQVAGPDPTQPKKPDPKVVSKNQAKAARRAARARKGGH